MKCLNLICVVGWSSIPVKEKWKRGKSNTKCNRGIILQLFWRPIKFRPKVWLSQSFACSGYKVSEYLSEEVAVCLVIKLSHSCMFIGEFSTVILVTGHWTLDIVALGYACQVFCPCSLVGIFRFAVCVPNYNMKRQLLAMESYGRCGPEEVACIGQS